MPMKRMTQLILVLFASAACAAAGPLAGPLVVKPAVKQGTRQGAKQGVRQSAGTGVNQVVRQGVGPAVRHIVERDGSRDVWSGVRQVIAKEVRRSIELSAPACQFVNLPDYSPSIPQTVPNGRRTGMRGSSTY